MTQQPQTFVRNATGLVRNIGFLDQFLISQSIVNPAFGFVPTALYAPYFFPGAYLPLVFLIGSVPAFAMVVVYSKLSGAMPRSGGDYVWSTRILGPLFGMIQFLFLLGTTVILGGTFASYSAVSIVLTQLLFGLGVTTQNHGLLSSASSLGLTGVGFPVDMLIFLVCFAIVIVGMKLWVWFQRVSFVLYYIVAAIFIGLLITTNPSSIPTLFDNAMRFAGSNATYSGIISQASSGGFSLTGFNLNSTLLAAIPWGFLTFTGFNYGTYLAGETKNAKSSITKALLGSAVLTTIILVGMSFLAYNVFGQNFLNAASYVAATNGASLPVTPTVSLLFSFVNPGVALFLGISFLLIAMLNAMGDIIAMSRMTFAASFDRLLPSKLADVNARFSTPHWAILFISVIWGAWIAILWFAGEISTILNTSLVVPIGYALPLVATLLFYFRRRQLFNQTLGGVREAAIIIFASAVGIAAFGLYIFAETVPISSGIFLGSNLALAFEVVVGFLIAGILIYAISTYSAKRSGIDLSRIYAEIPPE